MTTIHKTSLKTVLWLTCAAAAVAAFPASASLADEQAAPTRVVEFADLDLTKPAGVQTLYRRIHSAARAVCAISVGSEKYVFLGREQACVAKAVSDAVNTVQSTALAELAGVKALRLASK